MSIISSVIVKQIVQPGGSINVTERHTDHVGVKYPVVYRAPSGTDLNLLLDIHATQLEETLRESDIHYALFNAPWEYVIKHATKSETIARVRELYKESIQDQTALIAFRMLEWITNGRYTQLELRTAFELDTTQWSSLKVKMLALIADYQAVQLAEGE